MRIRIVGVGMGPQHVTAEAAAALRSVDYVLAAEKSEDDHLLDARRAICRAHGDPPVVAVPDPPRDRDRPADYPGAVDAWHLARTEAYERVLAARAGDAAFLVWGDPAFYDSTIRVVERIRARGRVPVEYDVLPGVSAPQLLAARHRIVLHEVGRPLHVTTARRLPEAVAQGQDDIVVMLNREIELDGLDDWSIWWGANLGTEHEALVAGRVGDVLTEIRAARERVRRRAGWVLDIHLVRRAHR